MADSEFLVNGSRGEESCVTGAEIGKCRAGTVDSVNCKLQQVSTRGLSC